jgi:hypothetical protein
VRLEPDEGKLSRPVLRGPGRSNPARLPDPTRDIGRRWVNLPFAKHVIEVLTTDKAGDPARRRFVAMFPDSDFGGLEMYLTKLHVRVYIRKHTGEKVDSVKRAMGNDFPYSPWGNARRPTPGSEWI